MAIINGTDAADNLSGTFGDDKIYGAGGDDIIGGSWGDDVLYGDAGNDYLAGGNGADVMYGGDGNDTIVFMDGDTAFGGDGDDYFESDTDGYAGVTLDGGGGFEIVDLNRAMDDTPIYLDDAVGTGGLRINNIELLRVGYAGSIYGGSRNDRIEAGSAPYHSLFFHGGAGDDALYGYRHDDFLYGDDGDDIVDGGSGANTLDGGDGFDFLDHSDREWSTVDLGVSTRQFVADYTNDIVLNFEGAIGGGGRDEFYGATGANTLIGGGGDDLLEGRDGDDLLEGGIGADVLFGGHGDDVLSGDLGDDTITGGDGWDTLLLSGTRDDYRVLRSGDGYIVKGIDGSDQLSGVEMLQFSDGSVIDLARQVELPPGQTGAVDDAFVLPALPDYEPLVLPGVVADKFAAEPMVLPGDQLAGPLEFLGLARHLPPTNDWMITLDPDGGLMGPQRTWGDDGWLS